MKRLVFLYSKIKNISSPRWSSTENSIQKLQNELSIVKSKIQTLEDNSATNAMIKFYVLHKLKILGIQESLCIFSKGFHYPIYCHKHIPTILAHFVDSLDKLPSSLNIMPSILAVRQTLLQSFNKLTACEIPVTQEKIDHFKGVIDEIEETHAQKDLLLKIGKGLMELKERLSRHRRTLLQLKNTNSQWSHLKLNDDDKFLFDNLMEIQKPLDTCNQCMIAYNFITRMFLTVDTEASNSNCVGMVDLEINLERIVRNSVDEAKEICIAYYGDSPDVKFVVPHPCRIKFPFMKSTIRYIVIELMKNAFRATVEAYMCRNTMGIVTCDDMPSIEVLISLQEGTKHCCVRISDEGMGMNEESLKMAMAYSYTSVAKPVLQADGEEGSIFHTDSSCPLAGYGYGLPMSRVYARFFGGDLVLQTMEGYGTRAYYYIRLP